MKENPVETESIQENQPGMTEEMPETDTPPDTADYKPQTVEERLTAELAASEARILRLYAEFDNYKKRFDREIARQLDSERDKFIHSILGVGDNLRRALRIDTDESSPYRDGLLSVLRHIDNSLRDFGAEQIPAEKGQQMDPNLHDAVTTLSVPGVEHGAIIDVAEPGYAIGDRVVRPAKVVVAKSEDE